MRRALVLACLIVIGLSWWRVFAPRAGLVQRAFTRDGVPMLYLAPADAVGAPGVVVAHGFAASKQIMLGYAYVLAHAGYAVLLFDFDGQGANPAPLARDALQGNLATALAALAEQPEVDPARLALVGHSMGSGAVMTAGIRASRVAAVVAISPTDADVTPQSPRNLLLQAGALEGQFAANARRLLASAGGAGGDPTRGTARGLVIVPWAEHISILFRAESQTAARDWLDAAFAYHQPSSYIDRRILWYFWHLLAWLGLWAAVVATPRFRSLFRTPVGAIPKEAASSGLSWLGLVAGAVVAGGALAALGGWVDWQSFGGLLVGGAVAVWYLVAGGVWLAALAWGRRAAWGETWRPMAGDVGLGLLLFALLWVAFGALGQVVWVQWLLVPARLLRWPLIALACLPWCLAAGLTVQRARGWGQAGWWLAPSAVLVGGFLLALWLVPGLGFIVLLLPLFPALVGILIFAGGRLHRPWAFALGSALFFAWAIAAAFPLA